MATKDHSRKFQSELTPSFRVIFYLLTRGNHPRISLEKVDNQNQNRPSTLRFKRSIHGIVKLD